MIVQLGDISGSGTIRGNSDLRLPGARAERNIFGSPETATLDSIYLHKESVLVAVVLEQIVVQLGGDSLPVAAVQVPNCRR